MLTAFALAFRQLGDRKLMLVVVQSLAITLVIFTAIGSDCTGWSLRR